MKSHAGKSATRRWSHQKISGLLLIFLGSWFLGSLFLGESSPPNPSGHSGGYFLASWDLTLQWLKTPLNSFLFWLFVTTACYHGCLGCGVIVEDYCHSLRNNKLFLGCVKAIFILLALTCFLLILRLWGVGT